MLLWRSMGRPVGWVRVSTESKVCGMAVFQREHTESAVPGERGEDTKSARDAKEHGVVVHLLEAVVLEENARVGIDVGPGVLGLALLEKDRRDNLVEASNEVDEGVALHVLQMGGEHAKARCVEFTKMHSKQTLRANSRWHM